MNCGILLLEIIKNIAVIAMIVYLVSQCETFRHAIDQVSYPITNKGTLIVIFGLLGASGNYLTVPLPSDTVIDSCLIGIIVGGLIGGPVVGAGTACMTVIPRCFMAGPQQVIAAAIVSVASGLLCGVVCSYMGSRPISLKIAVAAAFASEIILKIPAAVMLSAHKIRIADMYLFAPEVLLTCSGVWLTIYVIRTVCMGENWIKANAARKVIRMILATRNLFRVHGLTRESAETIVTTMYTILNVDYVGIYIEGNTLAEDGDKENIVSNERCLYLHIRTAGRDIAQILLNHAGRRPFQPYEKEWLQGFANFLGLELYQAELDQKTMLLSQAELNVLKSQIRPHFLFNMLSNIKAVIGENPDQAKNLICDLSSFLRGHLQSNAEEVTVEEEMDSVDAYLRLEKARYGKRLQVCRCIDPQTAGWKIPFFSIQILVENAIKHGLSKKKDGGIIHVSVQSDENVLYVTVSDNGTGMETETLKKLCRHLKGGPADVAGRGIGLKNVYDRLYRLYGFRCHFSITSEKNKGTTVKYSIPLP